MDSNRGPLSHNHCPEKCSFAVQDGDGRDGGVVVGIAVVNDFWVTLAQWVTKLFFKLDIFSSNLHPAFL